MLTKIGCMSSPCVSLSYSSKLKCFYCHYWERFNICRCIFYILFCFQQPNHFFCYAVSFLKATRKTPVFAHKTQLTVYDTEAAGNAVTSVSVGSCWSLDTTRSREKGFPSPRVFIVSEDLMVTFYKMWVLTSMLCKFPIFSVGKMLTCYVEGMTAKKHPNETEFQFWITTKAASSQIFLGSWSKTHTKIYIERKMRGKKTVLFSPSAQTKQTVQAGNGATIVNLCRRWI